MPKKRKGINFKRWFYDFGLLLKKDGARIIFCGAACEQWVNGELFKLIAQDLRKTPYHVYPEWKKRDITIFEDETPILTVEVKIIYNSYSKGKWKNYFEKQKKQLKNRTHINSSCQRVGLFLGIFSNWEDSEDSGVLPKKNFKDFKTDLRKSIGKCLKDENCDHGGSIETLLPEQKVKIGCVKVNVGAVWQYFKLK